MYKFKFEIIDAETDEQFGADWTIFDAENISQFGECETVDIHVASLLRCLRRIHAKRQFQKEE